jgi:cytochrome c
MPVLPPSYRDCCAHSHEKINTPRIRDFMSNLNMNKAAAAILVAGLIGMFTGKITEFLYYGGPEHPGAHTEEKRGYSIEITEAPAGGAAVADEAADISALYATADVKAGEEYFGKKCAVCHSIEKGGANKVGPHLWGIMNRPVGSIGDFNYSSAMKAHGGKWTFEEMNKFQWNPKKTIPGTIMSYGGNRKDQERANLIAYLAGQSDSPPKLPVASAKPAEAPTTH